MNNKERLLASLLIPWLCFFPGDVYARNCIKGKPCGKGCIALNKTCRIDNTNSREHSQSQYRNVLRRSELRLPKVYIVNTSSVTTKEAPFSKKVTGHYKQGQSVFVYETEGAWARLSNMQPEEWLELEHLQLK